MKYKNPVIPGFYPDPSICRAGDDYYLVTSSFKYFPGVPIFHSRDLINWRQIGYCLTRKSQLPLEKIQTYNGIYAPTIRYHDGLFYVITTNVPEGGNFYVYAKDPKGEWSKPIWVEGTGIDPSLFFDDDGKVYFTGTGDNCIVQSEIDIKTGKHLTDIRYIWSGTGGTYPEGPHLYKINGLYYLMIAEGGTEYDHMETIARSKSPWGPFESCPRNPILTHRDYQSPIQATGHADLIQAHDGSWWAVFLGIRPNGDPPCHNLGRETFLAPVTWVKGEWPVIGQNGKVSLGMEADCLSLHPWGEEKEAVREDFQNRDLSLQWNFLGNPRDGDWSLTERRGWLRLLGSEVTLDDTDSPAFVGRRQRHCNCCVSTLLDFSPRREGEEAGLTVFMNESHHYEIAVAHLENKKCIMVRHRIGKPAIVVACEKIGSGPVRLRIESNRDKYYFSYALADGEFKALAEGETRNLSSEVAGGFTGVYFGMYAAGGGRKSTAPAFFDWFDYRQVAHVKEIPDPSERLAGGTL